MNKIEIVADQLVIQITGWDKFFAFKGEIKFPIANITDVYPYNDSLSPPWLKNPGTAWPGTIIAGTYQDLSGRKEFWCTHFNGNTLVIDLDREQYQRIAIDLHPNQPVAEWIGRLTS